MSEQENKVPTAVEIERALRERRQQELEQASTDSDKEMQPNRIKGWESISSKIKEGLSSNNCGLPPSGYRCMFLLCAINYSCNVQL